MEKTNIMTLTKHGTEKDRCLKTQMHVTNMNSSSGNEVHGEKICSRNGFFKEYSSNLGMEKVIFPENTFIYKARPL